MCARSAMVATDMRPSSPSSSRMRRSVGSIGLEAGCLGEGPVRGFCLDTMCSIVHNHSRFVQYFSDCAAICATSRTISARSSSRCGEKSGVTIATEIQTRPGRRDTDWDSFLAQLEEVVMQHPVVTRNGYCEGF